MNSKPCNKMFLNDYPRNRDAIQISEGCFCVWIAFTFVLLHNPIYILMKFFLQRLVLVLTDVCFALVSFDIELVVGDGIST